MVGLLCKVKSPGSLVGLLYIILVTLDISYSLLDVKSKMNIKNMGFTFYMYKYTIYL